VKRAVPPQSLTLQMTSRVYKHLEVIPDFSQHLPLQISSQPTQSYWKRVKLHGYDAAAIICKLGTI
jgi:hypothetical protein